MSSTSKNDALDRLFGPPPVIDAFELQARQDHLRLLAHTSCSELFELIRLRDKLAERGTKLAPLDCFRWLDTIEALEIARHRYVRDFRRYDGPQIMYQAAENFAGPKIAQVIVDAMDQWRLRRARPWSGNALRRVRSRTRCRPRWRGVIRMKGVGSYLYLAADPFRAPVDSGEDFWLGSTTSTKPVGHRLSAPERAA